jgi:hypothetical protein
MTRVEGIDAADFAAAPYPGQVPAYSFVHADGRVLPLAGQGPIRLVNGEPLAHWLRVRTHERYGAVLAYGSNRCPSRLQEKFGRIGPPTIALYGTMRGAQSAWCRGRSPISGVRPWTLVESGPESYSCHVLLVAESNMPALDQTEGRGGHAYKLVTLRQVTVDCGLAWSWTTPITYLGLGRRGAMILEGRPLTVADRSVDPAASDTAEPDFWDDSFAPSYDAIPLDATMLDATDHQEAHTPTILLEE